jgi:signal transduction histidine kinase
VDVFAVAWTDGLNVVVDVPPQPAWAWRRHTLTQVLVNLLHNAVKFNDPGGKIRWL